MADRRFRRYKHCRGRYRIGLGVELAMTDRGGDIDRPVAGAADVGISPSLDRLIGANLVAEVVDPLGWGRELIAEFVVKPLAVEIPLVARYPLVQPHMRGDNKLGHVRSSSCRTSLSEKHITQTQPPNLSAVTANDSKPAAPIDRAWAR